MDELKDNMIKVEENFTTAFKKTLDVYIKYADNNKDAKKMLQIYDNLDIKKLSKKIYANIEKHIDNIDNKNSLIFNDEFIILSGVNITNIWNKLNQKTQDKLWLSLKILLRTSEIIINYNNIKENMKENNEFNPYDGLKGGNLDTDAFNNSDAYGKIEVGSGGIDSLMKVTGGMDNLNKLSEQLKNMKDEDIEAATKNIKGLLGESAGNMDEMLKLISSELKTSDSLKNSGDIFSTLQNVAESVSNKMKPKIDSGEVDGDKLYNSTKGLMDSIIPEEQREEFFKNFMPDNK